MQYQFKLYDDVFAYIFPFFFFDSKCNKEMVELLPLNEQKDLDYVKELLVEFKNKTGSVIAAELIENWPAAAEKFVKVSNKNICQAFHSLV